MMKTDAVKNEDFQLAKNLKERIQRLKNLGEQISLLESRKEKAIQKEDYDSAMVLKEEIQRLRNQFEVGQDSHPDFPREGERERERELERERERDMRLQLEREFEMNKQRMKMRNEPPTFEPGPPSMGNNRVPSINTSDNQGRSNHNNQIPGGMQHPPPVETIE